MPCGRCRQLLWEDGGAELLVDGDGRGGRCRELLPGAFDPHVVANGRMNVADIIKVKRDGERLTDEQIRGSSTRSPTAPWPTSRRPRS